MVKTTVAGLCAAFLLTAGPAMAAQKEMPQGKRDQMSTKDAEHQVTAQRRENKEADKNVDSLIKNRK